VLGFAHGGKLRVIDSEIIEVVCIGSISTIR